MLVVPQTFLHLSSFFFCSFGQSRPFFFSLLPSELHAAGGCSRVFFACSLVGVAHHPRVPGHFVRTSWNVFSLLLSLPLFSPPSVFGDPNGAHCHRYGRFPDLFFISDRSFSSHMLPGFPWPLFFCLLFFFFGVALRVLQDFLWLLPGH